MLDEMEDKIEEKLIDLAELETKFKSKFRTKASLK